jgi:hypothetical protein
MVGDDHYGYIYMVIMVIIGYYGYYWLLLWVPISPKYTSQSVPTAMVF